ncbi:hypothetical protein B0H15DRAFT_802354 [Mycena belliarum]|uniref:Uncharacterized protein n=1 Tax=Mycena belliarum TaxID=1033014 RepID=A0AAD6U4K9_9AGAR|nr:hypothetical protein B0H15DRAFT_802354 [Mycena belliae]
MIARRSSTCIRIKEEIFGWGYPALHQPPHPLHPADPAESDALVRAERRIRLLQRPVPVWGFASSAHPRSPEFGALEGAHGPCTGRATGSTSVKLLAALRTPAFPASLAARYGAALPRALGRRARSVVRDSAAAVLARLRPVTWHRQRRTAQNRPLYCATAVALASRNPHLRGCGAVGHKDTAHREHNPALGPEYVTKNDENLAASLATRLRVDHTDLNCLAPAQACRSPVRLNLPRSIGEKKTAPHPHTGSAVDPKPGAGPEA